MCIRDRFVDITDTFDTKMRALRSHESQVAKRDWDLEELMRQWGERLAKMATDSGLEHYADNGESGDPGNRLCEAFRILDTA